MTRSDWLHLLGKRCLCSSETVSNSIPASRQRYIFRFSKQLSSILHCVAKITRIITYGKVSILSYGRRERPIQELHYPDVRVFVHALAQIARFLCWFFYPQTRLLILFPGIVYHFRLRQHATLRLATGVVNLRFCRPPSPSSTKTTNLTLELSMMPLLMHPPSS